MLENITNILIIKLGPTQGIHSTHERKEKYFITKWIFLLLLTF